MSDDPYPLMQVLENDPRYPLEAYMFVRESLRFASDVLELGIDSEADSKLDQNLDRELDSEDDFQSESQRQVERHMTGQQLCEAIRQFALNQFGYMAKVVMNEWGIRSTTDYGNIVYNMINAGLMRKSDADQRSDFDSVYDFESEFDSDFEIASSVKRPIY